MNDDKELQIHVLAMVWYKRENYERIRSMCEDGDKLHRTYEEWLKAAEAGRKSQESKAVRVICVNLDPDEFASWCKTNGMKLNAAARNRYAGEAVAKAELDA